jgi:hypothetical protein
MARASAFLKLILGLALVVVPRIAIAATSFSGTVWSAGAGNPRIANATVRWGSFTTTTDADGRYSFTNLPCGTLTLTVTAAGFNTYSAPYTPTCNGTSTKNVQLGAQSPELTIVGNVWSWGAGNPPIVGARVQWGNYSTTTGSDGAYAIGGVPCGSTTMTVTANGFITYSAGYAPTCGTTNTKNVALTPALVSFAGRVYSWASGNPPVVGAQVQWGEYSTTTDVNGNYGFSNLSCGSRTLTVSAGGYLTYSAPYDPGCGATVTKDVALTPTVLSFHGRVWSWGAGNPPIAGATVIWGGNSTTTAGDGTYNFNSIACGSQTLTVSAPGFFSYIEQSFAPECGLNTTKDVALTPSIVTFSGRVYSWASGNPSIGGASVQWGSYSTTTDPLGNYSFTDVLCGNRTLTVSASGYLSYVADYDPGCNTASTKDVALTPTVLSFHGRVWSWGAGNPPIAGATVEWSSEITTTDANGNYSFTNIPCASTTIRVQAPGFIMYDAPYAPECGLNSVKDVALTPDTSQDPYVVVSATTDSSLYQNGVGTVHMTFMTRSNWGTSQDLHLSLDLEPSLGATMHVGDDVFALLTPGQEHVTQLSWQVPDSSYAWEMAGDVELTDNTAIATAKPSAGWSIRRRIPAWFQTNPLSLHHILEAQQREDECLTPEEECRVQERALLPIVGSLASLRIAANDVCKAAAFQSAGDYGQSEAALRAAKMKVYTTAILQGLTLLRVTTPYGWTIEVAKFIHSAGVLARNCQNTKWGRFFRFLKWAPKPGVSQSQGSAALDSVVTWLQTGIDTVAAPLADAFIVAGHVALRIEAAGGYAVADSTGLIYASVDEIDSVATIGMTMGNVYELHGSEADNPHSVATFRATSLSTQALDVGILHRGADGTRRYLRYPEFPIITGGRLWITLADSLQRFPLWVDDDNDPQTPARVLQAIPTDAESRETTSRVASLSILGPTPVTHDARIRFSVALGARTTVRVYDVAGRRITTLFDQGIQAGSRDLIWTGRSDGGARVASGVYFVRLTAGEATLVRRVVLIR